LPPEKSVSWARRRARRERGDLGGESGLSRVRESAICGRFTHCALCAAAPSASPASLKQAMPVRSFRENDNSCCGFSMPTWRDGRISRCGWRFASSCRVQSSRVGGNRASPTDGLASTLVGFMGTRRLSLSRLTAPAQYSCFPPTIVRRRIEAIRRKRACRGIALFLSSERGWIG